ncbi:MAG TPA: lactonase family protein [Opitutaceae bacterium]|nr:lactonase family protein [Opitutaceae bacterium]
MHLTQLPLVATLLMGLTTTGLAKPIHAFIGTYTNTTSKGIYSITLDSETGKLSEPKLAATAANPSFLGYAPNLKTLYAISESGSSVEAFSVGKDHTLRSLGSQPTVDAGPADVAADPTGKLVVAAIYGEGSTVGFPVQKDGSIGARSSFIKHEGKSVHPTRQKASHAHGVTFSKDGKFVAIPDLGIDQVKLHRVESSSGQLSLKEGTSLSIEPGSGPRHAVFSRDGHHLYVINELSSTITVASFDRTSGQAARLQTISTLPTGYSGNSTTAEIAVHPNDRFIYGSNRGHDSIAVFRRDAKTGQLTWVSTTLTGGKTPRNFALTPDGNWLIAANQDSDTLHVFRVNSTTGELTATGHTAQLPRPVCVRFTSYP